MNERCEEGYVLANALKEVIVLHLRAVTNVCALYTTQCRNSFVF